MRQALGWAILLTVAAVILGVVVLKLGVVKAALACLASIATTSLVAVGIHLVMEEGR